MKLAKLRHDPLVLADFFQEGFEALGGLCERTWHDRLRVVAEGRAARLWNTDGALIETELHFPPADDAKPRQADREVFPGCPLTFHLVETLCPAELALERAVLRAPDQGKPPATDVAEKLWRAQMKGDAHWLMEPAFAADWHFSLVVLARCEIQAIDQHWSLHRIAVSLPDGQRDEALASGLDFAEINDGPTDPIPWPAPDLAGWQNHLRQAVEQELSSELALIRQRQESYLRRELERVDAYFESYEQELASRRTRSDTGRVRIEERLASARVEHDRRRHDQVQRHEIRVIPHCDALLLLAEPAWRTCFRSTHHRETRVEPALLVPRARRWIRG